MRSTSDAKTGHFIVMNFRSIYGASTTCWGDTHQMATCSCARLIRPIVAVAEIIIHLTARHRLRRCHPPCPLRPKTWRFLYARCLPQSNSRLKSSRNSCRWAVRSAVRCELTCRTYTLVCTLSQGRSAQEASLATVAGLLWNRHSASAALSITRWAARVRVRCGLLWAPSQGWVPSFHLHKTYIVPQQPKWATMYYVGMLPVR